MLTRSSALLAFAFAGAAAAQVEYTLLPTGFVANGLSGDGNVVVGYLSNRACTWTPDAGVTMLLGPSGESWPAHAWGANDDASVIVGAIQHPAYSGTRPFVWTAATGIQVIADAGRGTAYNVSLDGSVISGDASVDASHAGFVWRSGLGSQDIGLDGGIAICMSADGRYLAGATGLPSGDLIRWDLQTGMAETLNVYDQAGSTLHGMAYGISLDGSIVVGSGVSPDGSGGTVSIMWTTNGLEYLGPNASRATTVTADGRMVGGRISGGGSWVSTPGLPYMSLESYLHDYHGFTLPSGGTLNNLHKFSLDGSVMIGATPGQPSWRLRIPPSRPADFNRDEFVDFTDLDDFLRCFEGHHLLPVSSADLNHDGITDFFDIIEFLDDFER